MTNKLSLLRVAMFGAGRMGVIHATTLSGRSDASLACIVDSNASSAGRLAIKHGVPVMTEDEVFNDPDIDAIIIASAASSHPHLVTRAVASRKAIFCEKPLARDLETVLSLADAVEKSGLPFLLAFNRRFDPDFAALAKRIHSGEIGPVELAILTSRDPAPPPLEYVRESGGLFRETTIHDIDVARWLTGEEPVSVQASASAITSAEMKKAGFPDTAVVTLTMPSGAIVSINNSWRAAYGYDQRVEVLGAGGLLKLENRLTSTVTLMGASGTRSPNPEPFFLERYPAAYSAELDFFIAAVRDGAPVTPGVTDGIKALRIAIAAEEAASTGRSVALV